MQIYQHQILHEIISEYSRLKVSFNLRKRWHAMSENELWNSLCTCILSSNVPYELALSAFRHLRDNLLLSRERIMADPNACQEIASELSKAIYWPKRKDGSCRRYRFPNVRAINIVKAAEVLYSRNPGILWILKNSTSERQARDFLANNVPGIGLKEASHFLRDIGYSESLAIIDTHVITFLAEVGALPGRRINSVTPRIYMKLERILLDLCDSLGLNVAVFDMAIWRYMRGKSD